MSAVERLDEMDGRTTEALRLCRAEDRWAAMSVLGDSAADVPPLTGTLRAVLAALDEYTDTVGVIFADDIRLVIDAALDVEARS